MTRDEDGGGGGENATGSGDDPTVIRSLAVSASDVVDAFLYTRENPEDAVLRVTPPFHGRMRARLHVYHLDDSLETGAIHLQPATLLEESVVDAYSTLEVGSDRAERGGGPTESDAKRTRDQRTAALESWRDRAREGIVDSVVLETGERETRVDVKRLG